MKRALNYHLQVFKRYKMDLIILIIYPSTLHSYVAQHTIASYFSGLYAFPVDPWVSGCTIISKESLGEA
ncbi:hypothetical protein F4703DRAFT_1761778 [Phycomyces blakesleeanus]